VASTTLEVKFAGTPAAAQLAARAAGLLPCAIKRWSQGSLASSKVEPFGAKSSVMAGARKERVKLPRMVSP
jgi:hypothetical protein